MFNLLILAIGVVILILHISYLWVFFDSNTEKYIKDILINSISFFVSLIFTVYGVYLAKIDVVAIGCILFVVAGVVTCSSLIIIGGCILLRIEADS